MPQSLSNVLIHLVFSAKDRTPSLDLPIRQELYPYLSGVLHNHGCPVIQIGGVEDHVHLLFRLSRTVTQAQVVEKLKSGSSKWIKSKWPERSNFAWQAGYGDFSVGARKVEVEIRYVANQEEHHRRKTFQEEFRELLEMTGTPYDERYVWD